MIRNMNPSPPQITIKSHSACRLHIDSSLELLRSHFEFYRETQLGITRAFDKSQDDAFKKIEDVKRFVHLMDDQYKTLLTSMSTLCEQMAEMVEDKKKMIVDINELKTASTAMKLQLEALRQPKEEEGVREFIKQVDWLEPLSDLLPDPWPSLLQMDESLDFVSGVFVH